MPITEFNVEYAVLERNGEFSDELIVNRVANTLQPKLLSGELRVIHAEEIANG